MSSPVPSTTTLLRPWQPHVEACPCPTALYSCTARLLAHGPSGFTSLLFEALLSPGDPVSVVLPFFSQGETRIVCEETPYQELSWFGVPARLIRVRLGLPVVGRSEPRPFTLLALLPLREVEDVPPLLRLGAEFLYSQRAEVHLSADPCEGRLIIPGS